jgi:hypothetical protein
MNSCRFTYLALTGLTLSTTAYAGNNGQDVFEFLNLGAGPRQIAMADASVALADDASASYYNPAAIGRLTQNEAAFMDATLFQDAHYDVADYVYPDHGYGGFMAGLEYLSYGSVATYDTSGKALGSSTPSDFSFSAGWGNLLFSTLYGGVKVNYIHENLVAASANGYGLDLGIQQTQKDSRAPLKWSWGAALQNVGPDVKFESASEKLPTAFVLGGGLHMLEDKLLFDLDLHQPFNGGTWASAGTEYWVLNEIALRFGYRSDQNIGVAATGGVGLKMREVQVDLALESFGDLGMTYRAGILYRFGGPAEDTYKEGLSLMKQKHYAEAIIKFDEVLKVRPDHMGALQAMRICYDKLRATENSHE